MKADKARTKPMDSLDTPGPRLNCCSEPVDESRRRLLSTASVAAIGGIGAGIGTPVSAASQPGCMEWTQPTDATFDRVIGHDQAAFVDRLLTVVQDEIVPLTRKGVEGGSKLFGGAVLRKKDLSTVVAATNTESGNPLLHGEIQTINTFYDVPKKDRPPAGDTVFLTTHEPCPLCLSGITWGGFDNFFYLFSYEDSRDAYGIPHDLKIHEEVFRVPDGTYNESNHYWSAWHIQAMIANLPGARRAALEERVKVLYQTYAELSDVYQEGKKAGTSADVPLK